MKSSPTIILAVLAATLLGISSAQNQTSIHVADFTSTQNFTMVVFAQPGDKLFVKLPFKPITRSNNSTWLCAENLTSNDIVNLTGEFIQTPDGYFYPSDPWTETKIYKFIIEDQGRKTLKFVYSDSAQYFRDTYGYYHWDEFFYQGNFPYLKASVHVYSSNTTAVYE
ncbi:UNKNOWN [Stylonychia lemnae]|uniref:Uncharacterized protein n=1 Tax=Stylonychia lemnae TaxID=5949 RepID=A0A077ZUX3_STYLE|nr:UNKNOWN [Stylonychia lemnae]|eukprot:CDW73369.1 UNKNOWN [Stylonychia lemnae]